MNLQGKGFYFSSKDDLFMKNSFGNKIMKCYLSIKNPFYGYGVKYNKSILQKYISEEDLQKIFEGNNSETFEGFELFFGLQMSRAERNVKGYDTIDTTAILKNLGFDGIYLSENNVWVAFEPNQIKSIDNNGEWNSNSNNIYETYDYIDDTEVLLNPTKKEFNDLLKNSKNKQLRAIVGPHFNDDIYVWDAYYGTHDDIFRRYIYPVDKKFRDGFANVMFRKNDYDIWGFTFSDWFNKSLNSFLVGFFKIVKKTLSPCSSFH